jgi:hypothetical protein
MLLTVGCCIVENQFEYRPTINCYATTTVCLSVTPCYVHWSPQIHSVQLNEFCSVNHVPRVGGPVMIVGHGVFSPTTEFFSSVTRGILSRVTRIPVRLPDSHHHTHGGGPTMSWDDDNLTIDDGNLAHLTPPLRVPQRELRVVAYQSDAAVHAGNSGGALGNSSYFFDHNLSLSQVHGLHD